MKKHLEISDKEFAAVSQLDGVARYKHFIKRVADWQEVWGLYDDGWLTLGDDDGRLLLPLWPARRYAEAYRDADWGLNAEARPIPLDEFLEDWLPGLRADGRGIAAFPVREVPQSVHPSVDELDAHLREELGKY